MPEENQQGQMDNQVQAEGKQAEGVPTSDKPAEVSEADALENSKNPDRTREYIEKLKAENKQLKEQQQAKPTNSVLDIFPNSGNNQNNQEQRNQAPNANDYNNLSQNQVNDIYKGLVDDQGYIDPKALEQRLNAANNAEKIAKQAEKRARNAEQRIQNYEQTRQTKELYGSYPELDPESDNFNKEAYDLVKNEIFSQWASSGTQDAMKAAKKMEKYFRSSKEEQKQTVQQAGGVSGSNRSVPPQPVQKGVIRSKDQFRSRLAAYEQSLTK